MRKRELPVQSLIFGKIVDINVHNKIITVCNLFKQQVNKNGLVEIP